MPISVRDEIANEGMQLELLQTPETPVDAAHMFVTERGDLESKLNQLLPLLDSAGMIWISWPKQASNVPTNISEDAIRDVALPLGLVDVKVCAVDHIWSGLKLVVRRQNRGVR